MVKHSPIEDHLADAAERRGAGEHERAAERAAEGLQDHPDAPALLRILIRARLSGGALEEAAAAAARLARLPGQSGALELLVELALEQRDLRLARRLVAEAEAGDGGLSAVLAARLKARIALADGDIGAARAIVVTAAERAPDHPALRALLTEVMVAAGTASDARAVLTHLGKPPVNPADPATESGEPSDTQTG